MIIRIPRWLSPGWWLGPVIEAYCVGANIDRKYWAWSGNWLVQQIFNVLVVAFIVILAP